DGGVDLLEHLARADVDALHGDRAAQDRRSRDLARPTGQHADELYAAAGAHGAERSFESSGAAHLDDDVGTSTARRSEHRLAPVGIAPVIDGLVGTHATRQFQFLVAARGDDAAGTMHLRELKRE